ncbi:hypothetical protein ABZ498_00975 [Streptomyces lavendulocolor]|uniref:hypothetical protein n=1 Tax=Streptomyces lavendulocolor TaxID=67316 RepID=UPI0033EEC62C
MLLVTLPASTAERLAVEAELRKRGWPSADSPAAAAVLLVAGQPGDQDLEWLRKLWEAMPQPKAYAVSIGLDDSPRALDHAREILGSEVVGAGPAVPAVPHEPQADPAHHGDQAGHAHEEHHADQGDAEHHHGGQSFHDDESRHDGHAGHDEHAGHEEEHGGHGGHAGHHGGVVGGLPMAERAEDRDGLRLDRLHLSLGPALPDWPAGLVLDVALQGDVVQHVQVTSSTGAAGHRRPFWDDPWLRAADGDQVPRGAAERRRCAAHLDSLGRFLAVAGWPGPAERARGLRDAVLTGAGKRDLARDVRRFHRRVAGSRTFRRLMNGLGELPAERAGELGITGPALVADGDVYARVRVWLDAVERSLERFDDGSPMAADETDGPRGRLGGERPPSHALIDAIPVLVRGAEFACARLIVASLDPDPDELRGGAHG